MRWVAPLGATAALLAFAALTFLDGPPELAVYELLIALLAVGAFRAFRLPLAPGGSATRRRRKPDARPPQLRRLERMVGFAASTAFDSTHRLLPLLRDLAADRLLDLYGVDLASQPAPARDILGDRTWEILRPGGDAPAYGSSGIPLATVEWIISDIEGLERSGRSMARRSDPQAESGRDLPTATL